MGAEADNVRNLGWFQGLAFLVTTTLSGILLESPARDLVASLEQLVTFWLSEGGDQVEENFT